MSCSNWQNYFCSFKRDSVLRNNSLYLPNFFPRVHASEKNDMYLSDYKKRIKDFMNQETGKDRVRNMFSKNEYGLMSPELQNICRGSISCAVFAAVYGAIQAAGQAREDFLRKNVATPYESEFLARRQMSDKMALAAVRGGLKHTMKLGSFSCMYLFITMTTATYNNKITVYEHVATGALLGTIGRINYGLKGMAVSGSLGGFLGLIASGIILLTMKLSGISFEELRYWQHETYWNKFYNESLMESKKQRENQS